VLDITMKGRQKMHKRIFVLIIVVVIRGFSYLGIDASSDIANNLDNYHATTAYCNSLV